MQEWLLTDYLMIPKNIRFNASLISPIIHNLKYGIAIWWIYLILAWGVSNFEQYVLEKSVKNNFEILQQPSSIAFFC